MTRPISCFVFGVLLTASAGPGVGQTEKSDDKVAEQLDGAKKAYRKSADAAATKLLEALAKQRKDLLVAKNLPEEKLATLIKELADQTAAFEADPTKVPQANDPVLRTLRDGRSTYDLVMKDARQKCERAFDDAARAYRNQDKINLHKQVLDEKARFFEAPGGGFAGTYLFFPEGKQIVFTTDGQVILPGPPPKQIGTWKEDNKACVIQYTTSGWKDVVSFDKNGKDLIGKSYSPKGKQSGTPIFKAVPAKN